VSEHSKDWKEGVEAGEKAREDERETGFIADIRPLFHDPHPELKGKPEEYKEGFRHGHDK